MVTEHGIDERGERFIVGDYEDLYEVDQGIWYGWPHFASGVALDDPARVRRLEAGASPGRAPRPILPLCSPRFQLHTGANGLDFCHDPSFGFPGDAFVTLFGDVAPVTTSEATPGRFKVARSTCGATPSRQTLNRPARYVSAWREPRGGLRR